MNNIHAGSNFDDFLKEEGLLADAESAYCCFTDRARNAEIKTIKIRTCKQNAYKPLGIGQVA
ncbi:MAG: hypothetical protein OEL57_03715 [Trichlorobacter sp.]|uniref:hypothetical protein n=1 Tax=Trichlorobacter sp. TaxID=2911007 RepID=UPI00256D4ABF|nr:hypothetical protein [Trichlorobacter sp.]MDK9716999.1 hypothetical protein [Trichlorobacter sp.]